MALTPIPQNYKKNVDWIKGAYTDAGVTFPDGFQKDAIQNAVGARKTNKWDDWGCDISCIENAHGKYIVIEDSGTVGLTGQNISADVINEMMANEETLPSEERLARFTSMFNSGGNTTGGGLFGAGKSVYSVASQEYVYYFDSLREDGLYVANVNKSGQVNSVAYEAEEAKKYIFDNTGLSEKKTVGTRVIIVSPTEELMESITSGDIIPFIQESWWKIIQRLPENAAITVNGVKVVVPEDIKNGRHSFELTTPEVYEKGYRVKQFGLYTFAKGANRWSGISYYRKGMKIGEVDIKDIPKSIEDCFWGHVEVDEDWEEELSEIEDKIHFGVSKGKKKTAAYQNLKNYCNNKAIEKFREWGYIKDKETEDKKLKDEMNMIAEELQDLFDRLGFEDLGKGPQKSDFDVRLQNITYPVEGSERVEAGDKILFSVRIKSSYAVEKNFAYALYVVNPHTGAVVSSIEKDKIKIAPNTVGKINFVHTISENNSVKFAQNKMVIAVKVVGSGKEKRKELPYFFGIDKPDNSRDSVNLVLHECRFPHENSRRINFGESLNDVRYWIENKRNEKLEYRLNVSVHNASDSSCPKIADVISFTGSIEPFEEIVTEPIKKIEFSQATFEPYLSEGVLELRARLIANADDSQYEKGDKITSYYYKIFLNCDEKNGKKDSFDVQSVVAPDDFRRSWHTAGNGRTITLNVGHLAYTNISDYPDVQHGYIREQMLKQYVLIYLDEGKYDMFKEQGRDFTELEPQEAADQVLKKMESVYYESLI